MGDGYNFQQLKAAILALSKATDWEVARKEWKLVNVYEADEQQTCLCGHFPIREICEIANGTTQKVTEVGNCCVKRFFGFRSDAIFASLKRISKDGSKSLGSDAIAFFFEKGIINAWEHGFLQSTMRKRNLSFSQLQKRVSINEKVLASIKRRGLS